MVLLVAGGWTPPAAFSDSLEELLTNPTAPLQERPSDRGRAERATGAGGSVEAVFDDDDALLNPYRAEMRAQALVNEKAAEANRLGLELLRQQQAQQSNPPPAQPASTHQPPVQVIDVRHRRLRRPVGVMARAAALVMWLTAMALTAGGCLTVIGLTTASTTGIAPEPPTSAELGERIDATYTARHTSAKQRLCNQYPTSPGCPPPTYDGDTE